MRQTAALVVTALVLTLCAGTAFAQDVFKVDYFANANTAGAPDGTVRLTNPGTSGGNICAAVYVTDPTEETTECCSCLLSPDGLRTLSVNTDLTSNPLTGVLLTTGTIYLISTPTVGGACPLPSTVTPTPAIRAWATHIQNGSFAITETASQDATLSSGEQIALQNACHAIKLDGSKHGVCTCGTGD